MVASFNSRETLPGRYRVRPSQNWEGEIRFKTRSKGFILMKTPFFFFACFAIVLLFGLADLSANDTINEKILQLYPEADTNGDGVLSDAEEAALSQQAIKRYPEADANGDGVLSDTEKQELLRTFANGARRKRASTTTDKTKKAAAQEVRPGVFRTPDERFENLQDYPFAPHYVEVDSRLGKLRVHYVDVGARDADPILLLHGEPSWSYLYRKMIPPLVAAGHRVIAPDLIGFGRSDKPAKRSDHSYPNHVEWMMQFVTELDLKNVTLFCQDWGSLIGLRVVTGAPDRFARIVAGNAALPAGPGDDGVVIGGQWNQPDPNAKLRFEEGFMPWLKYSQTVPKFDCGLILQEATMSELTAAELEAYRAPFPDERYNAGPRVMPTLVRSQMASNRKAWKVLTAFDKPFLTTFSDRDPVTKGGEKLFQKRVPGAKDQPHTIIRRAGHFLQEDASDELAKLINSLIATNPAPAANDQIHES
jgi:haloalkane dehalogenase